jgi:hypothetical protein
MVRTLNTIGAILTGISLLLFTAFIFLCALSYSNIKERAFVIPQDCGGTTVTVNGVIVNEQGIPIAGAKIRAFHRGRFDITARSNQGGYFETEGVFTFACYQFTIEISAPGYQDQRVTYHPPGGGWPDEIPKSLIITLNPTENGP